MRNEQEFNDREYRGRDRSRDQHHNRYNRFPEHHQNSASRWGNPDPYMRPDNWEQRRQEEYGRDFNRNDWRPFEQRDNRYLEEENYYRNNYREEHPDWQQQDRHFSPNNQHANDRWNSGREFQGQHHHHHPRHASERFYREQRRRY